MDDTIKLILPRLAVERILNELYYRLWIWDYTQEYLETGLVREPYCIEECSDADEARSTVEYYKEIIQSIEKQAGFAAMSIS